MHVADGDRESADIPWISSTDQLVLSLAPLTTHEYAQAPPAVNQAVTLLYESMWDGFMRTCQDGICLCFSRDLS